MLRHAMKLARWNDQPEDIARKNKDHLAACSCDMCRNPRTSKAAKGKDKLTRQELRALGEHERAHRIVSFLRSGPGEALQQWNALFRDIPDLR
jgi:hypothetical protein